MKPVTVCVWPDRSRLPRSGHPPGLVEQTARRSFHGQHLHGAFAINRPAEQVALELVAVQLAQEGQLVLGVFLFQPYPFLFCLNPANRGF